MVFTWTGISCCHQTSCGDLEFVGDSIYVGFRQAVHQIKYVARMPASDEMEALLFQSAQQGRLRVPPDFILLRSRKDDSRHLACLRRRA